MGDSAQAFRSPGRHPTGDYPRHDTALLDRLRAGDDSALSALHERHVRAVYGVVADRLGAQPVAVDVTHDVFLMLWRKSRRIKLAGTSCLRGWWSPPTPSRRTSRASTGNTGGRARAREARARIPASTVAGQPDGARSSGSSRPSCGQIGRCSGSAPTRASVIARPSAACWISRQSGGCGDGNGAGLRPHADDTHA